MAILLDLVLDLDDDAQGIDADQTDLGQGRLAAILDDPRLHRLLQPLLGQILGGDGLPPSPLQILLLVLVARLLRQRAGDQQAVSSLLPRLCIRATRQP